MTRPTFAQARRCALTGTLTGVLGITGAAMSPAFAQTASTDPALRDVIVITANRDATATEQAVSPGDQPAQGPDVTYLLDRTPGAARVGNGALSGQAQYRGLFGERLNLRVDGQHFGSGGPNLMDPAFHYAPAPLIAALVIDRGVSPVSEGPGLAGGMDAVFKRVDYADSDAAKFGYDLSLDGRSVDQSYAVGGVAGASTRDWRLNLLGSWEQGEDTDFPDGTIGGSSFERGVFGASGGVKFGNQEVTLDLRRQNTGPSGNPPFPMDIQYFDTDFAKAGYNVTVGDLTFHVGVNYMDVSHLMDNFSMRPAPMATMLRATYADATTNGLEASVDMPAFGGLLTFGADREATDRDVTITNPANANFYIRTVADMEITRTGGFVQWTGDMGPIRGELGARVDQHETDAGQASTGSAVPMMAANLAAAFNAADRSKDDTTWDLSARLWTPERNGLSWRATLARKTRVPGYIERFSWLPTQASGGLADGNIYVGDLNLKPETAWIAEGGFDYRTATAYVRPTIYVRQVDDYIQGVPFDDTPGVINTPQEMVANMNGDPTPLRFGNVDARLYGFDVDAGMAIAGPWRVDAVASYVRGERRDIDDNLYRVAPPSLTVGLTYEQTAWSGTLEARAVAKQDEVSTANSEAPTDGFVVLNAYGDWTVTEGVKLSAGIENLLDQSYEEHLSGYNRNAASDVPVGARLPGAGRGVFVRLSVAN
ncbi:MAG: TonB-dependent receptor [Hyphomonadaceae bacterium]